MDSNRILLLEYKPEPQPVPIDHWRTLRLLRIITEKHKVIPQATRAKGGRPRMLKESMIKEAGTLAGLGLTEEQIALFFGVNPSTLFRWKRRNPEFCTAIIKGKENANLSVRQKLYKLTQNENAKSQLGAIIFWLINQDKAGGWRNPAQMSQTNITKVETQGKKNGDARFTGEEAEFQSGILADLTRILKV